MTHRQTELTIAAVGATTALNAVGGSIYGLTGAKHVPVRWLEGSPFRDYRVPSLILGVAVGGSSARAAVAAWRGEESAGDRSILAGSVLLGWIAAQVAIIGYRSILQPLMAGVGATLIGLGASLR